MSRASRRQKLQMKLEALETDFGGLLLEALQRCALGDTGIFGHNDELLSAYAPPVPMPLRSSPAERLLQLGHEITGIRRVLGIPDPFPAYTRYLEYRRYRHAGSLGERRLAAQFLAELHETA